MNCQDFQLQISALLDGELGAQQHREVEIHLRTCAVCREFHEDFVQFSRVLTNEGFQLTPSQRIWASIAAQVRHTEPEPTLLSRLLQMMRPLSFRYGLAGGLAVLVLALLLNHFPQSLPAEERRILSDLATYEIEVGDNPFLEFSAADNPFSQLRNSE